MNNINWDVMYVLFLYDMNMMITVGCSLGVIFLAVLLLDAFLSSRSSRIINEEFEERKRKMIEKLKADIAKANLRSSGKG